MKNKVVFFLSIVALVSLFWGCEPVPNTLPEAAVAAEKAAAVSTGTGRIIKDTGVVRFIGLEGGFYGLVGRTGNYDPVNLPKEFQKDGLRVQFSGEVLNVASIHMWGTVINLISIATTGTTKKIIMDTGVLHQRTIQGSPWVAEASTGTYQILNLPREYMVENLKVVFCGTIRTDIIIIPALWPLVELFWIQKLPEAPLVVNLREEFKLQVGKSASVPAEGILFTFKSVLQDSRCPSDVNCIWQGEAIIVVNVKIGNVDYGDYKMSTLRSPDKITVGKYTFQFNNLVPYPVSTSTTDPNAYIGYFIIYPAVSITTL